MISPQRVTYPAIVTRYNKYVGPKKLNSISNAATYLFQHWMFAVVGENMTLRLRKLVFSCMLRQEIGWFDQPENKVGVLTSRLAVDASIVRGVSFHREHMNCTIVPTELLFLEYINCVVCFLYGNLSHGSSSIYVNRCYHIFQTVLIPS